MCSLARNGGAIANGSPHGGQKIKPLLSVHTLGFSQMHNKLRFSPPFFLSKFTWKFRNNSAAVAFSVSAGLCSKPSWSHQEPESSGQTSNCLFPVQGPCPPVYQFCSKSVDPFSSPPGATFVADSIWFHRALRRGAGGHLAQPTSLPRSGQFANCSQREPESSPKQAAPVTAIV